MRDIKLKLPPENVGLKGRVLVHVADASSVAAARLIEKINAAMRAGKDRLVRTMLAELNSRFLVERLAGENTIPTVAQTQYAKFITNQLSTVADLVGNYGATGTGSTAFSAASTQLNTEIYRKLFASRSYNANKAYFTSFYDTSDFNDTVKEHAVFMNGTASANTGTALSLIILNGTTGVTKDGTQTLTVEHEITHSEVL